MGLLRKIGSRTVIAIGVVVCLGVVIIVVFPPDGAPAFILSLSHAEGHGDGGTVALVRIENVGSADGCYYGYGVELPAYEIRVWNGSIWTNGPNRFWCGTGLRPVVLTAGKEATFQVSLPTNNSWKVGLNYRKATFRDRLPEYAAEWLSSFAPSEEKYLSSWSNAIQANEKP